METLNDARLELPRIYYKGYKLKKDQEKIPLKESENGFLETKINKSGIYELTYNKTPIMKLSYILLSLNIFIHIGFIVWTRKKDNGIMGKNKG